MHDTTLMIQLGTLAEGSPKRHRARMSARDAMRRLWPLARTWRWRLSVVVLCVLLSTGCDVAVIAVFDHLTDHVLVTGDFAAVWAPAGLWLALAVLGGLATFAANYLSSWVGEHFLRRVRDRVFQHLQRLSPDFFDARPTGDLVERLTSDVDELEQLVVGTPVTVITGVANTVCFVVAALLIRWDLALLCFAAAPLFWLCATVFTRRIRAASRAERDSNGALTAALEESLSNMALVQAYNRQRTEGERVHRESVAWMTNVIRGYLLCYAYGPLATAVETVCVLGVLAAGAWEIGAGRLTLGGLLAFAAYLGYLYPQIQSLGSLQMALASGTSAAERVIEILDTEPTVRDPEHPLNPYDPQHPHPPYDPRAWFGTAGPAGAPRGVVSFERVGFGYPGSRSRVLNEVSFTARPGRLVLIDGPSGAGKSTLAKLLLRMYDPSQGTIRLDGADIAALPLRAVRDAVTLVPQETMVFGGSIRENIAFGRPDATDEEIRRAAAGADLAELIDTLPDGYDTVIGTRGRLLSGGQRQRLAIARALVRDTPVLVLDEPTTGLDAAAADRVLVPLRRLMAGRTTFLITHDPRLAAEADAVLSLADGVLVTPAARTAR